jgi:hypothetical protein
MSNFNDNIKAIYSNKKSQIHNQRSRIQRLSNRMRGRRASIILTMTTQREKSPKRVRARMLSRSE